MSLNYASQAVYKNKKKILALSAVCSIALTGCETVGQISAAYLGQVQQTQKIQSQARANCNGVNEHGYNYWDTTTNSCKFVSTASSKTSTTSSQTSATSSKKDCASYAARGALIPCGCPRPPGGKICAK